ncbi:hypothetical protein C0J52_02165 [Blattella germanica]|nr:hypothetical protein C0J52_02165 [Blattella germanica]
MNENDLFAADTVFKNIKKIMYPMYNLSIRDNITSYLSSLTSVRWRYLTLTPGGQKFKLPTLDNASLFLTLDSDLARNRSALFLRHDKIIVELFNLVNELLETFVFMFTSFSSEWNTNYVENRHLVGPQIFSKPILLKNKAILMFSKTSPMITIRRPSYMETLWLTNMTSLAAEENELIVQAPENCINIGTIKFKYSDFEGYMWSMDNIIISPKSKNKQMNGSLKLKKKVTLKILDGMPRVRSFSDMSYNCHRSIVFSDQEGKI